MSVGESEGRVHTLNYGRPPRREPWIGIPSAILAGVGVLVLALLLAEMQLGALAGMVAIGGVSVCWGILPVYCVWRDATAHRRMLEADFEEEFSRRRVKNEEMVALAARTYANGPVGRWRWADVVDPGAEELIVNVERELEFQRFGQGRYWMRSRTSGRAVEAVFEYGVEREGVLRVRMLSPRQETWGLVWFEFGVGLDGWGEAEVTVCFRGVNRMERGLEEYWPFFGEMMRVRSTDFTD